MRDEPSKAATDLALALYNVACRRERRGENDPTHVIAVALQGMIDERDELRAKVELLSGQIAVTMGTTMSYVDDDLRRACRLIVAQPGVDVAHQVRALCLAFSEVRRDAFERAALVVESCTLPADDLAQCIRGLK